MVTRLEIGRESGIMQTLKMLKDEKLNFVVVGGYAVDAYALHRFSVDLDLVVQGKDLLKFRKALRKNDYKLTQQRAGFDITYGGRFEKHVKKVEGGAISVDLLVNSLVSRITGASWSFDFIKKNSLIQTVRGITTSVEAFVPSKELLIAAKLHSGRLTDLRDMVMLSTDINKEKIIEYVIRGKKDKLKELVVFMIKKVEEKAFADSLKGVFGIGRQRIIEKEIAQTKQLLVLIKEGVINNS